MQFSTMVLYIIHLLYNAMFHIKARLLVKMFMKMWSNPTYKNRLIFLGLTGFFILEYENHKFLPAGS